MTRRLTIRLLILALLVQALSVLLPSGRAHAAEEVAHRFVHAEAVAHHHELDASLFLDAEDEAAFHMHVQDAGQPFALLAPAIRAPLLNTHTRVWPIATARVDTVFLEGLLRPPSLPV